MTVVSPLTQKTDSGSMTDGGVYAYAALTWLDNLGTSNQLVSVTGGWSPGDNPISNRAVTYGVFDGTTDHQINENPDINGFTYYGTSDMVGFLLGVETLAFLEDYDRNIEVYVHSSIFTH